LVFSKIMTSASGSKALQVIAPKNPAAPPPITIIFMFVISFRFLVYGLQFTSFQFLVYGLQVFGLLVFGLLVLSENVPRLILFGELEH